MAANASGAAGRATAARSGSSAATKPTGRKAAAGAGGGGDGSGSDGEKPPRKLAAGAIFRADPVAGLLKLFENNFPSHDLGSPKFVPLSHLKHISGTFNYAIDQDGNLFVGRVFQIPGGGHIDLVCGKPVRAAGEVKVVDGEIKYIDNSSGHYLPFGESVKQEAEKAFRALGFDTEGKYLEKVWVADSKLPRGGA